MDGDFVLPFDMEWRLRTSLYLRNQFSPRESLQMPAGKSFKLSNNNCLFLSGTIVGRQMDGKKWQ